jgi:hypothetical protein
MRKTASRLINFNYLFIDSDDDQTYGIKMIFVMLL